nr:TNFAIP3-interacting protein 1-like isoform X2 [Oncorhynchus nerka]XP_029512200.1 TNFAIP3-interacting protein 1-like isoform X2 [Oncorhynchus nerka]
MEGKGPYRIYDPGGGEAKPREAREEGSNGGGGSYRLLLEENSVLRERMKGLKSLGDLLEESQWEASKLRQRVEELVRDNEALKSSTSSFATSLCMGGPVQTETQGQGKLHRQPSMDQRESQPCLSTGKALNHEQPSEGLSEFEVVNMEKTSDTQTVSTNFHTGLANNNGAQMGCLETIQVLYVIDSVSSIKVCVCVCVCV